MINNRQFYCWLSLARFKPSMSHFFSIISANLQVRFGFFIFSLTISKVIYYNWLINLNFWTITLNRIVIITKVKHIFFVVFFLSKILAMLWIVKIKVLIFNSKLFIMNDDVFFFNLDFNHFFIFIIAFLKINIILNQDISWIFSLVLNQKSKHALYPRHTTSHLLS